MEDDKLETRDMCFLLVVVVPPCKQGGSTREYYMTDWEDDLQLHFP